MISFSIDTNGKIEIHYGFKHPKRNKGQSILAGLQDYVVIDLETTGLAPQWDSIIEVAAIRFAGEIESERFQTLVNPGFMIDGFITELTGITNEMLSGAPKIDDVLPNFVDFIGNSIIVGHNVNFDVNFIYDNCTNLSLPEFKNDFVDTMRLSRWLFSEYPNHRLIDLVERFGIGNTVEHRALADAVMANKCYEYMKRFALDREIDLSTLGKHNHGVSAKDIKASKSIFNENTPMYGKTLAFTGTLEKTTRREAMQAVVDFGGKCGDGVTKDTNYLVLGNNDYCTSIKDGKSNKQKKAEKYKLSGQDIEIISENVFYDMLSECGE